MHHQSNQTQANTHDVDESLTLYTQALKAHFPSKEAILNEALALSGKQKNKRKRVAKAGVYGSACLLIFAITWWMDPVLHSQQMATNIGEKASLQMPDGSAVMLNTNSIVHAESRLFSRRVVLAQGEALFTVVHGWKSFTVQANNTTIRDIGTVFNVRSTQDGAIVTVLEGAVEVSSTNSMKAQMLIANQSLHTYATTLSTPINIDASNAMAWQQGRLLFDGTPLSVAIAEIQRYRKAPIILQDQQAASLRISGAYDITGIESLIDTLPMSVAVKVHRKANGTVIIQSH